MKKPNKNGNRKNGENSNKESFGLKLSNYLLLALGALCFALFVFLILEHENNIDVVTIADKACVAVMCWCLLGLGASCIGIVVAMALVKRL